MNDKKSIGEIGDIRPELMPTILTYVSEIASLIVKLYDLLDETIGGERG